VKIAVTGANSGVGAILLRHLTSCAGIEVIACVRSPRAAAALSASPHVSAYAIDYDDSERLAAALDGASCVVHLAGVLLEGPTSTYQTANVDSVRTVVNACRTRGIPRVVLVSALGADPDSPNRYWSSKGRAERIVVESELSSVIIRTPILLGPGMAGARAVLHAAAQRTATLLGGGRHVIRPLDAEDLSLAVRRCCTGSDVRGGIYELVGPEPTLYRELIARTATLMGRQVSFRSVPVWLAKLGAAIAGLKREGGMTPTVIDVITSDEAVHENADVELGVTLTPLEATLRRLLTSETEVLHH
jgi:uncharacterized protein YbjT (DUF2867 family)